MVRVSLSRQWSHPDCCFDKAQGCFSALPEVLVVEAASPRLGVISSRRSDLQNCRGILELQQRWQVWSLFRISPRGRNHFAEPAASFPALSGVLFWEHQCPGPECSIPKLNRHCCWGIWSQPSDMRRKTLVLADPDARQFLPFVAGVLVDLDPDFPEWFLLWSCHKNWLRRYRNRQTADQSKKFHWR